MYMGRIRVDISGKHTIQNAARCRDILQHPWLCDISVENV